MILKDERAPSGQQSQSLKHGLSADGSKFDPIDAQMQLVGLEDSRGSTTGSDFALGAQARGTRSVSLPVVL